MMVPRRLPMSVLPLLLFVSSAMAVVEESYFHFPRQTAAQGSYNLTYAFPSPLFSGLPTNRQVWVHLAQFVDDGSIGGIPTERLLLAYQSYGPIVGREVINCPRRIPDAQVTDTAGDPRRPQVSATLIHNGSGFPSGMPNVMINLEYRGTVACTQIVLNTTGRSDLKPGWTHDFLSDSNSDGIPDSYAAGDVRALQKQRDPQGKSILAFSSSNPSVGTVDANGRFVAIAAGSCNITVTCDNAPAKVVPMVVQSTGEPVAWNGFAPVLLGFTEPIDMTTFAKDPTGQALICEIVPNSVQGGTTGILINPMVVNFTPSAASPFKSPSFQFRVRDSDNKWSNVATVTCTVYRDASQFELERIMRDLRSAAGLAGNINVQPTDALTNPGRSSDPIRYFDGGMDLYANDLEFQGSVGFGLRRSYSNVRGQTAGPFGPGWQCDSLPRLSVHQATAYVHFGSGAAAFTRSGTGPWTPKGITRGALTQIGDEVVYATEDGASVVFHGFTSAVAGQLRGSCKRVADAGGVTLTHTYASDRLASLLRTYPGSTTQDQFAFEYQPQGLVSRIVRSAGPSGALAVVRQVVYEYYSGAVGEFGERDQLKRATILDAGGAVLARHHYRYWRSGDTLASGVAVDASAIGGLRFACGPMSYARIERALTDVPSATNVEVSAHAEKYFEYDTSARVTKQILRHPEIDGVGTYTYVYTTSAHANGYNSWKTKCVETLPDGKQNIVYCNYAGAVLLQSFKDGTNEWIHFYRHDAEGREFFHATPSAFQAVSGKWYDEAKPDLVDFASGNSPYVKDGVGLVLRRVYYTSTTATATTAGGVTGYLQHEQVQQGELGSPQTTRTLKYRAHAN